MQQWYIYIISEERFWELLQNSKKITYKWETNFAESQIKTVIEIWNVRRGRGEHSTVATDVPNDECENVKLGPNSYQNN